MNQTVWLRKTAWMTRGGGNRRRVEDEDKGYADNATRILDAYAYAGERLARDIRYILFRAYGTRTRRNPILTHTA